MKHSGLGIASFVISLLVALGMCLLIALSSLALTAAGTSLNSELPVIGVGILMMLTIGASLVSIGLGIGSLFEKLRRKVFGILGIVFSILTNVGLFVLVIIGNQMTL